MKNPIKISLFSLGIFVLATVLHNFFYALFGIEEPVTFLIAIVSLAVFIISTIYSILLYIKSGKTTKDKIIRLFIVGSIIAILALDWASLDDITTGNESNYAGEYAYLAISTPILIALIIFTIKKSERKIK